MTNRVKQLNGRKLDGALKHGATSEDLCQEYGCTEAQLERQISQIYNRKATKIQGIWKQLRANAMKRDEEIEAYDAEAEDTEEAINGVCPEKHAECVDLKARRAREERVKKLSRQMDELAQDIEQIQARIAVAQDVFDACSNHVDEAERKLEVAKEKVAEANGEMRRRQVKYDELCGIADEKYDILASLEITLSEKLDEANSIQNEIWDLTQVTLGVDIDEDEIMLIDNPCGVEAKLDYTGAEEIFDLLIQESECESLTVRALRLLSYTIAAVRNLGVKSRIECDDQLFVRLVDKFM